jgi:hypothetical protein
MKVDYLWNKTGSDPEIEKLEIALQAFRLRDETPPAIKLAEIYTPERNPSPPGHRRRSFQFAVAGFACLGLLILSAAVLQVLRIDDRQAAISDFEQGTDEVTREQTISPSAEVKPEKGTKETDRPIIVETDGRPQRADGRPAAETKKRTVDRSIYRRTPAAKTGRKRPAHKPKTTVRLTREEKEAYEQLMKALAITGSQMRIVREKIRGEKAEAKSPVKKDGR